MTRTGPVLVLLLVCTSVWGEEGTRTDSLGDPLPAGAKMRLGTSRLRHFEFIQALACSPDGRLIASVSRDRALCVWETKTGKRVRQITNESPYFNDVAFAPDGKRLATAGADGFVRLWDVATGREVNVFRACPHNTGSVYAVIFTRDGKHLITSAESEPPRLWDPATGAAVRSFGTTARRDGASLALSPDGSLLLVSPKYEPADRELVPRLYEIGSGREVCRMDGQEEPWGAAVFSPDGRYLAGTGWAAQLLEIVSGQEVLRLPQRHPDRVAFTPDGRQLAFAYQNYVDVWDLSTGRQVRRFRGYHDRIQALAFTPDGKTLIAADTHIHLWDVADGARRISLPGHRAAVHSLALSGDGKVLASGGADGRLLLWEAATGRALGEIDLPQRQDGFLHLYCPERFAEDGKTLDIRFQEEHFTWDLAAGKKRRIVPRPGGVRSDDGKFWAIPVRPRGGITEIWDGSGSKRLHRLQAHAPEEGIEGNVSLVAFSRDSRLLATGGQFEDLRRRENAAQLETVHLWDVNTGRLLHKLRPNHTWPRSLTFSEDGRMLAVADSAFGSHTLWDTKTGRLLHELKRGGKEPRRLFLHEPVPGAFSPDGKLLALGEGGELFLYAAQTGRQLRRWQGHDADMTALLFSRDGRTLISASYDTTITSWDLPALLPREDQALLPRPAQEKEGGAVPGKLGGLKPEKEPGGMPERNADRELLHLRGHTSEVRTVAFSPDGKTLLTASEDGTLLLSELSTGRLLRTMDAGRKFDDRGVGGGILAAAFSPDGSLIASTGADGVVRLWDPATGKELRRLDEQLKARALAFASDGRTLAMAGHDRGVRLWDIRGGKLLRTFQVRGREATAVVFSRDGKVLHAGGRAENKTDPGWPIIESDGLYAWDVATGKELPRPDGKAQRLLLSPDGKTLALSAVLATFTPGAKHAAIRRGNVGIDVERRITLRELATGKDVLTLPGQGTAVAFSPDGLRLATGSADTMFEDGGGNLLGSYNRDLPAAVVDARTGRTLLSLPHEYVSALAFTPDGTGLVTGGSGGEVRLWDVTPDRSALKELARRRRSPAAGDLARLWEVLAGADGLAAYRAVWDLAAAGDAGVSFLGGRLAPREPVPARQLATLIEGLEARTFAEREKAAKELQRLGPLAEPALREALAGRPSLELRRHIERLLAQPRQPPDAETMRTLRAVQVLELVSSAGARRILEKLSAGAAQAPETDAARAALARLRTSRP